MCDLCKENNDEYVYCQDCGVAICFDAPPGQEWPAQAGVTASGDLFCMYHAAKYDREEEEEIDDEWGWMPGPWDN